MVARPRPPLEPLGLDPVHCAPRPSPVHVREVRVHQFQDRLPQERALRLGQLRDVLCGRHLKVPKKIDQKILLLIASTLAARLLVASST